MERHHHIDLRHSFILRNVSGQEVEMVVAIFLCKCVAVLDHIFLQIQSHHADLVPSHLMQKIIHGKGQVRLPASEIQNRDLPVFRKLRKDILDKFQIPVDLAEFVESGADNLSLLRHDSKITQERNIHSFL